MLKHNKKGDKTMPKKLVKAEEVGMMSSPATTPEIRENQLIAAAERLAEQQLLNGTASSAVIVHYLKLGDPKNKLEIEKMKLENELTAAKTKAVNEARDTQQMFEEAIAAFKTYSGHGDDEEDNELRV